LRKLLSSLALVFVVPAVVSSAASAQVRRGGYAVMNTTLDELVMRQSLAVDVMYFGGQGVLGDGKTSFSPHVYYGGYGNRRLMGGMGFSVQTIALLPVGVGAGIAYMHADFRTVMFGANVQKQINQSKWLTVLLQGAVALQGDLEEQGAPYALYLKPAVRPDRPEDLVIFDEFSWYHVYVHAVFELKLRIIKPLLDVGWLSSHYRYSGYKCRYDCRDPAEATSDRGTVSRTTFGMGVAVDIGALQAFGGIKSEGRASIIVLSLALKI
jgi:hypothetical protein